MSGFGPRCVRLREDVSPFGCLRHSWSSLAVHRCNFAGDGEVGSPLLAQPELTEHAVGVLGRLLLVRGRHHDPRAGREFGRAPPL